MLFFTDSARARHDRNRRKAKGLVALHGGESVDYVRKQLDAPDLSPRDRAHWQRIERHVSALLQDALV